MQDSLTNMFIAIIVILVIYILYCAYRTRISHMQYIGGYWESDANFNNESDIDSMIVYFEKPLGGLFYDSIGGYVVIMPDIASQPLKLSLRCGIFGGLGAHVEYDENEDSVLGDYVYINIDVASGVMRLLDGDNNLYGVLYKNHSISNYT